MRIFWCIIMMLVFVVTSDSFQSVYPLKQVIIMVIMDFSVGTFFMYFRGFFINIFIYLTFFGKKGFIHLIRYAEQQLFRFPS